MTQHILTLNNYLLSPASQFLNDLIDTIREYNRLRKIHAKARQTIKELNALSNRELNDIGIGRGDIHGIVYGDETLVRNS